MPPTPPASPGSAGRANPPNRFERVHVDEMPELGFAPSPDDPPEDPRTELLVDPSRTIVATNDSPDLNFAASVNPYRGCQHACSYCLAPETPVLRADLGWRALGELKPGDELVGLEETPRAGEHTGRLRRAVVERVWSSRRPTLRVITDRGEVTATAEHRWLPWHTSQWAETAQLRTGDRLRFLFAPAEWEIDADYQLGYVAGLAIGGEAKRRDIVPTSWPLVLRDREPLERTVEYAKPLGAELALRSVEDGAGARGPRFAVDGRSPGARARLAELAGAERDSASYHRGFLAGAFDARGQHGSSLRICEAPRAALLRVVQSGARLGFTFTLEPREQFATAAKLAGDVRERLRFLAAVRPAVQRKLERALGCDPQAEPARILAIEPGPERDVVDIQTSARTFVAAGLATHNCYARPTHEYVGYSAGLDFQTKILVKPRAAELLRKKLMSPSWEPQVVALSGVTDPYQPAERRLRITRGCLEVLAEFRNPVGIVTKGFLVTRDVDLLAELAAVNAATVMISITTLDPELQRKMEPLASPPSKRLAAIETLAKAGVPVGVMAAPVIPGLTDHELPAILAAAASAGARSAGRVVLRLPHGVKELFSDWLAQHYPERREKVLNRLRALHGGALYDSRFSHRQRGEGEFAAQIEALFQLGLKRAGLATRGPALSTAAFRRPGAVDQLSLFSSA